MLQQTFILITSGLQSVGVDWGEAELLLDAVVLINWFEFLLDRVPGF